MIMTPDEIDNCLVDLHATCYRIPFQRQGIPYFAFAIIGFILATKYLSKIVHQIIRILEERQQQQQQVNNNIISIEQIHLLLGRLGLFFVIIGTVIWDNGRVFCASWDISWPTPIRIAPNATMANQIWEQSYHYQGANLQVALTWMSLTARSIATPLALLGLLHIFYYKTNVRTTTTTTSRGNNPIQRFFQQHIPSDAYWLRLSGLIILFFVSIGALTIIFVVGPTHDGDDGAAPHSTYKLVLTRARTHILTLVAANDNRIWPLLRLNEIIWQSAILALSIYLCFLFVPSTSPMARQQQRQNPKIKRHLLLFLFANTLAVLLQLMVFYDKTTTKAKRHVNHHTWSPALGNLATVIAIASQYFLDSIYYPTEEDEEGDIGNLDRSQRQPLLSIQERDAVDADTAGAGAASTSSTAAAASLPAATGTSTRQTYEV